MDSRRFYTYQVIKAISEISDQWKTGQGIHFYSLGPILQCEILMKLSGRIKYLKNLSKVVV